VRIRHTVGGQGRAGSGRRADGGGGGAAGLSVRRRSAPLLLLPPPGPRRLGRAALPAAMGCQWSGEKADFHSLQGNITIDEVTRPRQRAQCGGGCAAGPRTHARAGGQVEEHLHIKAWKDPATRQRVVTAGPSGDTHDVMAIQEVPASACLDPPSATLPPLPPSIPPFPAPVPSPLAPVR
jgi:hypothetical protein